MELSLTLKLKIEEDLGKIIKIETVNSGCVSTVFRITTEKGKYFVKHPSGEDKNTIFQEKLNFILLTNKVTLPKLITRIQLPGENNDIFILKEILNTKIQKISNKVIQEIASNLERMHKIPCEGWGPLNQNLLLRSNKIKGVNTTLKQFLNNEYKIRFRYLCNQIPKIAAAEETILKLQSLSDNYEHKSVLCHGDLKPEHILSSKTKHLGLIDFDNIRCAPRIYDFAILYLYQKRQTLRIIEEYNRISHSKVNSEDIKKYAVLFSLPRIAWEHKKRVLTKQYLDAFLKTLNQLQRQS